jgi:hypothetical protein
LQYFEVISMNFKNNLTGFFGDFYHGANLGESHGSPKGLWDRLGAQG